VDDKGKKALDTFMKKRIREGTANDRTSSRD
jgi:hypothetical protein